VRDRDGREGRAADDVALVLAELPQQPRGEANLLWRASGAGDDKAKMPAGARFGDGRLGEHCGDLRYVSSEEGGIVVRDAARYAGGADALFGIIGAQYGDKFARRAPLVWASEQVLRVRPGCGKAPAGGFPQIVFQGKRERRHGFSSNARQDAVPLRDNPTFHLFSEGKDLPGNRQ
jgi:hypothetical protein